MGGTGRGTLGPLALSEGKRSTFIKAPLRFPSPLHLTPPPLLALIFTVAFVDGIEAGHGAAFFELLYKVMPDWERRKQRLERAMA